MIEDFKSISPFSDERVEGVVQDLLKDNEFHNALARINYPLVSKIFPFLTRNFMARKFRFYFDGAKTVKDFQTSLAPLVRSMINKTTSGFTITGEKVRVLEHNNITDGNLWWDLRSYNNQEVAPGLYYYTISNDDCKGMGKIFL